MTSSIGRLPSLAGTSRRSAGSVIAARISEGFYHRFKKACMSCAAIKHNTIHDKRWFSTKINTMEELQEKLAACIYSAWKNQFGDVATFSNIEHNFQQAMNSFTKRAIIRRAGIMGLLLMRSMPGINNEKNAWSWIWVKKSYLYWDLDTVSRISNKVTEDRRFCPAVAAKYRPRRWRRKARFVRDRFNIDFIKLNHEYIYRI